MESRPVSITVIAWILIVAGLWSLASILLFPRPDGAEVMLSRSPLGVDGHRILGLVWAFLNLLWGYGFLKGRDWARIGFVATGVMGIAASAMLLTGMPFIRLVLVFSLAWMVLIGFFLFRPAANRFFGRNWFAGSHAPRP